MNMKRCIAVLLILAVLTGVMPLISAEMRFSDVPGNAWYAKAVGYCADNHLMNGVGGYCFAPEESVTREMVVQTFYNMEGSPECEKDSGFHDVRSGAWYVPAINWAAQIGIAGGYPDGTFGVGKTVSREEFAAFLHRYAKTVEMNDEKTGDLSQFPDGDKTSSWAKTDMEWALGEGFLKGEKQTDKTVFLSPQGTLTRAQLATILMRFHEELPVPEGDYIFTELPDGTLRIEKYHGKSECPQIPTEVNGKKVTAIGAAAFQGSLSVKTIIIPKGITEIGDYAFECCSSLTSIELPTTLRKVGMGAFSGCVQLETVTLPEGVEEFGNGAFFFCQKLKSFSFPKSVRAVGDYMFAECSGLTKVSFEEGLTEISERMFWKCEQLQSAMLPDSVTKIGKLAFARCEMLSEFEIPAGVTSVGAYAFSNCSNLNSVTFPAETVCEYTFSHCYQLQEIKLTENVKIIESNAFRGASVAGEFEIPENVTEIQAGAFNSLNTSGFAVAQNNPNYASVDGVLMSKSMDTLLSYPAGYDATSYSIPDGIKIIAPYAFAGVCSLENLTIPQTVTTLENNAFNDLCNLPELVIPESVETIGEHVFENCTAVRIVLNAPITVLSEGSFKNCNSEEIILPDTLETIAEKTFFNCTGLIRLTLPKNLSSIEGGAFVGVSCPISNDSPNFKEADGALYTSDGKTLLFYCGSVENKKLVIPDGVERIADYAINSKYLSEITVPESLKNVGVYGFGYWVRTDNSDVLTDPVPTLKVFGPKDSPVRAYTSENSIGYFTAEPSANMSEITLAGDETALFEIENAVAEDVYYSCFDDDIASVTPDGKITAHKKGAAEVYASIGTIYFKCVVTVTSDGTPNEKAFDTGKYTDLTGEEVPAWLENYMKVNADNVVVGQESNPFTSAYKGENYYEGIWAAQLDESEYDQHAVDMFDVDFRPQMRMMGHGLAVELSRYEQPDDLVLYSGTTSFDRFVGGNASMKELKNRIGTIISEPYYFSTALQESVTTTFAGSHCSVFIIYADRELIDGGYIEGTVGQGAGGEYEILLKGGTRMEVIDAGIREISFKDEWTGEVTTQMETYIRVKLLPKE